MEIFMEDALLQWPRYQKGIPLNYQKMVNDNPAKFIGIGASVNEESIGVLLAKKNNQHLSIHICYMFVSEKYLSKGIEEQFLKLVEELAKAKNIKELSFEYLGNEDRYYKYIESRLVQNGWMSFHPINHIYTAEISLIENENWLKKYLKEPKDVTFVQWGAITGKERKQILDGESKWYSPDMSPFLGEERIDKNLSIGVLIEGRVVGWLILQEVAKNMVLFKSLYLHEKYRSLSIGVPLLARGIAHALDHKEWRYAMFSVEQSNKQMLSFTDSKLTSAVINKKIVYSSSKVL